MSEPSGIHLTAADSGWPIDDYATLVDGSGYPAKYDNAPYPDPLPHADGVDNGVVTMSEVQQVTSSGLSGTASVSFGTDEVVIPFDVDQAGMQAALDSLPEVEPGDVTVVAYVDPVPGAAGLNRYFYLHFGGQYAGVDAPPLVVENIDLENGLISVGNNGYEGGELVCPG